MVKDSILEERVARVFFVQIAAGALDHLSVERREMKFEGRALLGSGVEYG